MPWGGKARPTGVASAAKDGRRVQRLIDRPEQTMRGFFATAVAMAASLHCLAAGAEPFPIDRCPAPSAYSGKAADVDRECGLSGQAPEVEHQAQNQAKNNLCAANPGKAIPLTK